MCRRVPGRSMNPRPARPSWRQVPMAPSPSGPLLAECRRSDSHGPRWSESQGDVENRQSPLLFQGGATAAVPGLALWRRFRRRERPTASLCSHGPGSR